MSIEAAFVPNGEPSEAVDPGEASFDDPSVTAEFLRGVLTPSRDAGANIALLAGITAPPVIVGFVGVKLAWPAARTAALAGNSRNGVDEFFERHAVMDIGASQQKASGIRLASVAKWRFVPGLPRSVGLGPVAAPLFLPRWMRNPRRAGSSQCCRHRVAVATVHGAAGSTHRLPANRATTANT